MRVTSWGGLDCVVAGGLDGQGGGDGPIVVLLHGFGAPGDDLVALADELRVPREVRFVFPAAPIDLGFGRAWWMVDMTVKNRDWDRLPDELVESRRLAIACLDAAQAALGAAAPLYLGGFSQGAMLSCEIALHDDRPLAGVALLSGTLLTPSRWTPRFARRAGIGCLLSHGTEDPVLPFARAEGWRDQLVGAGWKVDWRHFRGGHGIPLSVLSGLGKLISGDP